VEWSIRLDAASWRDMVLTVLRRTVRIADFASGAAEY
jgi:hypothetical protein